MKKWLIIFFSVLTVGLVFVLPASADSLPSTFVVPITSGDHAFDPSSCSYVLTIRDNVYHIYYSQTCQNGVDNFCHNNINGSFFNKTMQNFYDLYSNDLGKTWNLSSSTIDHLGFDHTDYGTILACNLDILVDDAQHDVFFSNAPLTVPISSLVKGAMTTRLFPAFSGNLAILLPVGLVILAILLGVSLIPRVISLFR